MCNSETDEKFVLKYLEFRSALSAFVDKKYLKRFERELVKGGKFVIEVLGEICQEVASEGLGDLIVFKDRKNPGYVTMCDDLVEEYRQALDLIGMWCDLRFEFGKPNKISKWFAANREEIRKRVKEAAAQAKAEAAESTDALEPTAEAVPAP